MRGIRARVCSWPCLRLRRPLQAVVGKAQGEQTAAVPDVQRSASSPLCPISAMLSHRLYTWSLSPIPRGRLGLTELANDPCITQEGPCR
jgi:hypothetical protein